jgi:hypothetical protein
MNSFVFLCLFSPCMRACGLRGAYSGTIHYIGMIHYTTHHLRDNCSGTVALRANLLYRRPFLRSTVPLFICLFVCLFLLYQRGQPPSDLLYLRFGPNLLYQTFGVQGGGTPPTLIWYNGAPGNGPLRLLYRDPTSTVPLCRVLLY